MKHTPGPWVADGGQVWLDTESENPDDMICNCHYPGGVTKGMEIAHTNARLIAKAPEMYELLKEYWKQPLGASAVIKRDDAAKALLKEIEGGKQWNQMN